MNHRAMRRRLDEEIGRATRAGSPLSAILIDLDDFKLVNDRHGHQAGDAVLREVVQALVGEFRAFDRVARYGGDEFVVILPNADLRDAAAAAARALERMRAVSALEQRDGHLGVDRRGAVARADEHRRAAGRPAIWRCCAPSARARAASRARANRSPEQRLSEPGPSATLRDCGHAR